VFGHDWEPGTAKIVAVHIKSTTGDGLVSIREFAADVTPTSGAPTFRALIQEPRIATDFWAPGEGDIVRVQVDVRRTKARFDKDDPKLSAKAQEQSADAQFEATLHDPPAATS
jgi:hypothetical protein